MTEDPNISIAKLCNLSSSQEELLRRVPFTEEPNLHLSYDLPESGKSPIPFPEIVMVSLSDSSTDEGTPSESAQPQLVCSGKMKIDGGIAVAVTGGVDCECAVDLGKNSKLGFSKEKSIRGRLVSNCAVEKENENSSEAALRKSKHSKAKLNFDENLNLCAASHVADSSISDHIDFVPLINRVAFSKGDLDKVVRSKAEGKRAEREVEEMRNNDKRRSYSKDPDDIDKFRYMNGPSSSTSDALNLRRKLPLSVRKPSADWESDSDTSTDLWSKTIPKILEGLSVKSKDDNNLKNVSIFEIARRRGVVFPQPRWWRSPESYGSREN